MCRLLLLEDDRGLIDGLKYSLEKNGFDLDVARTVREARHALRGGHPYEGSVHFRKQKIYATDLVKNGLDHTQNGGHVTVS